MLIKEYNKNWVDSFTKLKQKLESNLPTNTKIEHVGSTSVPNLAAKAIIDIDIIYFDEVNFANKFEEIKKALAKIGYFHNGNQGIKDREVFKRRPQNDIENEFDEVLDTITHHLYVCSSKSKELERHLLFRDYLRQNEKARTDYQNLKYDLAEKVNQQKKQYAELKEKKAKGFINEIIERARNKFIK
ncbi:GrpB family protein [Bernardetia sp. OM2101]|uniref:GrpB family protein n=1 Tax=Bernardetia sp. OM2101 TaxID=3344876 RepID=UPI0035CFDF0C